MGNHGVASTLRAGDADKRAKKPTVVNLSSSRPLTLQNWPVLWRLIAVIVLALVMGLVFGGLRVAAAAGSAAQFGRVRSLPPSDSRSPGWCRPWKTSATRRPG